MSEKRASKRRTCFWCHKKPPRQLLHTYKGTVVFCSTRCAAQYGVDQVALQRWCSVHGEWYHQDDGCYDCKLAEREAEEA